MSLAETAAPEDMAPYLKPTAFIDSDDAAVAAFAAQAGGGAQDQLTRAVNIFYAVRDGLPYDPYALSLTPEGMSASSTLRAGRGFCITKATLLAACLRAEGIPARLGFADVKNHLSTERLRRMMGTDVFAFHGYTEVFLEGRWVKATPAFNIGLCERFGVLPLDFDGRTDSVFHPFDAQGRRHMEYVRDRGSYADVPLDEIVATFAALYPSMFKQGIWGGAGGDFHREAEAEAQRQS